MIPGLFPLMAPILLFVVMPIKVIIEILKSLTKLFKIEFDEIKKNYRKLT